MEARAAAQRLPNQPVKIARTMLNDAIDNATKALLEERSIPYEAVHLGEGLTMQGVKAASGAATVPQVFIGGRLVGGADQLASFLATR